MSKSLTFKGKGLTSRQEITVTIRETKPGSGITFLLSEFGNYCKDQSQEWSRVSVPATADHVCSTVRNTALGKDRHRVCYIEHLMCAIALCGIDDLEIQVDGAELPMGNGSSDFWVKLLQDAGMNKAIDNKIDLKETVFVSAGDKIVMALPDEKFSASYLLDMNHPLVGRIWGSWASGEDISNVASARTFGPLQEHKMLGFDKDVVSFTQDGFSEELRFKDEPVRHKILDLIGDMFLCGVNPLRINARFISIKGGHSLDVQMAKKLSLSLA